MSITLTITFVLFDNSTNCVCSCTQLWSAPHQTTSRTCYILCQNVHLRGHSDRPRTTTWSCHALGSSSANVRSASSPRERGTVFLPICAPYWTLLRSKRTWKHFYFVNLIRTELVCNFCTASLSIFWCIVFFVIGLVGLCCKPRPLVIIIVMYALNIVSVRRENAPQITPC